MDKILYGILGAVIWAAILYVAGAKPGLWPALSILAVAPLPARASKKKAMRYEGINDG